MAYEQRDNSGSLFKNDKRETDNHPNMTGSALIDGQEYWVSAWTKTSANGNKWVSLAFKPKEAAPAVAKHQQAKANGYLPDDDMPF